MPQTQYRYSKVEKSKLTPVESGLKKEDLSTYGSIRNIALPKVIKALGTCNGQLYDIYLWNENLPTNE